MMLKRFLITACLFFIFLTTVFSVTVSADSPYVKVQLLNEGGTLYVNVSGLTGTVLGAVHFNIECSDSKLIKSVEVCNQDNSKIKSIAGDKGMTVIYLNSRGLKLNEQGVNIALINLYKNASGNLSVSVDRCIDINETNLEVKPGNTVTVESTDKKVSISSSGSERIQESSNASSGSYVKNESSLSIPEVPSENETEYSYSSDNAETDSSVKVINNIEKDDNNSYIIGLGTGLLAAAVLITVYRLGKSSVKKSKNEEQEKPEV